MHYLILRVSFSTGQYGHKVLWQGTRNACESESWFCNIEGFRGPGIVKAEKIVIDDEAWGKIKALQVRRRG